MANSLKRRFESIAKGEKRLGFDPMNNEMDRLANLRPQEIQLDPDQPRKEMGDLEDLKASIAEHGILQPLIVSPIDETQYRLIAGERRYTAALELGLATVPAIVRTIDEHRLLEVQLIENLHRKDLTPFEEANAFRRLTVEFNLTQEQVAQRMGKTQAAISQIMRVLDLPEAVQDEYKTSYNSARPVSKSVLLEIARQETPEQQVALWEQASRGELTVQQARKARSKAEIAANGADRGGETEPAKKHNPYRHKIPTATATVILEFPHEPSVVEMIAALKSALASLQKK
jgi:ParB family chromosome partitioning protein